MMLPLLLLSAALFRSTAAQEPTCSDYTYNNCYGNVGCFDDCYPFDEFPRPTSPSNINTRFYLHTNADSDYEDYEIISVANLGSRFNASRDRTFMIIHDKSENREVSWVVDLVAELKKGPGDFNVVVVDWRGGAGVDPLRPLAPVAAGNTRVIAMEAYILSESLRASRGLRLRSLHCLGLGHGAHACGFLGRRYGLGSEQLYRVSGLDPSGGLFLKEDGNNTDVRMDAGDGELVDAVHSNVKGAGIDVNVGDVDFWPHTGRGQPGCTLASCSHVRAARLWAASVNRCTFIADFCATFDDMKNENCEKCSAGNCQSLGFASDQYPGRGTYHLTTLRNYPFC